MVGLSTYIEQIGYVIAAIFFITGLKGLSHPRTAVRGNFFGAVGMLLAIISALVGGGIVTWEWIIVGVAIGSIIGALLALKIQMTAMPQLVGLFNGLGGGASVLVALAAILPLQPFFAVVPEAGSESLQALIAIALSVLIGAVTLTGSFIAFAKLQGIVSEKAVSYPGQQVVKAILALATLASAVLFIVFPAQPLWLWLLVGLSAILGILLTISIGGADMPIVIALLNSYSGLAASATGFVFNNSILIIAGALVGASGIILTQIMCRAMNRSLTNVLFGGLGGDVVSNDGPSVYEGKITNTSADELAMILKSSQKVVIVPGYGMAVARAQTAVRQLTEQMEKDGIDVSFGIHPVAGRMPGHMNVLLAEENISYDKLKEMDAINGEFAQTDVAIVIGANDVVNPLARSASGSPISGMPILDVDKARTVVVIKRSLSPGFAGIENPLFAHENTLMLFADGKKAIEDTVSSYKDQ